MRISDWSSDVCSSDLAELVAHRRTLGLHVGGVHAQEGLVPADVTTSGADLVDQWLDGVALDREADVLGVADDGDRKSVVSGKSVSVRLDLGGRRIIKKTNNII